MIEAWVLDRKDDCAALPAWLAAAVKDRADDGMLVLTSRAGVVEARPGDLVMWDGERINVYCGHRIGACPARLSAIERVSIAAARRRGADDRRVDQRRPAYFLILTIVLFLGALAFGYAWLMINLIGHARLHY